MKNEYLKSRKIINVRVAKVAEILDMSFTIEHENNCQISFLDTLVCES